MGLFIVLFPYASCLQRLSIDFAGADAHGPFDVDDEDLAVAVEFIPENGAGPGVRLRKGASA